MNTAITLYQDESKQVVRVRKPNYKINKCKPTQSNLSISRTS